MAVLCCLGFIGASGKAVQPANSAGVADNVSAESAPPLYRNIPVGVSYASANPYAAYSFNIPQFVTPKFNIVPLNQERILAQSTNNYLRDSYGQRFVEAPQGYAYKAALPQQFVPLQKLPAHLSQPLLAAPNAQYGQATHFFGAAPFRIANLQAVSPDHANPFGPQPLVYAQNVRTVVASPANNPQKNAQPAQQQTSSNNKVYANFHQFWSAPKAQVAQEEPKISASDHKENQQIVQSLPLVHAPQQTTVTSFTNGKKTIVNLVTKPPVPLLDLTLLEPLTFENPVVPQHQHFLPKIHSVTYKKLPELHQNDEKNNNQKVITIKKKTTKKIKKTKKPKVIKEEVEVHHTQKPSVNIDDQPEITYEINSPNYKETISEKTLSYNKETHTKPVHVSYEKKTEMKPVSYSYGKKTQKPPVNYNYVVHSNEPAQLKQAYLDENKEKTKHLIYHFSPDEQSEEEEQSKSETPVETVEVLEENSDESDVEEPLPERQKEQDHKPQHKQHQHQHHLQQHKQHHNPKHELHHQYEPQKHHNYEKPQHHPHKPQKNQKYELQSHQPHEPQSHIKYEPQQHHQYEQQQHHQYIPQQYKSPQQQKYEPQQHHQYEQQQNHQFIPQKQQYEPQSQQKYEPQQHAHHHHHPQQKHEPQQHQHQKQRESQQQKLDNAQHELAEEAYNEPNQNFKEEPEPEHREVAYYDDSKENINPEYRQQAYYQNPKNAYVDSREELPAPNVYKSAPQQQEQRYEAIVPEYEEDITILPAHKPHAPLQAEEHNPATNKHSANPEPQSEEVYEYPQSYYNSAPAPEEKSNRIIVKDDPQPATEEVYQPNEELLEAMVKKQEESEEDFEQAYKNAAYGFPAYDSPVRNVDREKEIYNPANYGVPRYHNDFDEAKSQLRQYEPENDEYPARMRSNYQDTRDKTNDDYYKEYADSGPQSLVDRRKKKDEYYDNYNEHKPQNYYAKDDSDKQQSAKYTVGPTYSYPGGPQQKQYEKFTSRITPLDEYNYAKEKPADNSAFGTGVYTKTTQFLEPHYQYGFEPIRVSRLIDHELATMASDHSPETVKKIYKENFYIEKSSTSNVVS